MKEENPSLVRERIRMALDWNPFRKDQVSYPGSVMKTGDGFEFDSGGNKILIKEILAMKKIRHKWEWRLFSKRIFIYFLVGLISLGLTFSFTQYFYLKTWIILLLGSMGLAITYSFADHIVIYLMDKWFKISFKGPKNEISEIFFGPAHEHDDIGSFIKKLWKLQNTHGVTLKTADSSPWILSDESEQIKSFKATEKERPAVPVKKNLKLGLVMGILGVICLAAVWFWSRPPDNSYIKINERSGWTDKNTNSAMIDVTLTNTHESWSIRQAIITIKATDIDGKTLETFGVEVLPAAIKPGQSGRALQSIKLPAGTTHTKSEYKWKWVSP